MIKRSLTALLSLSLMLAAPGYAGAQTAKLSQDTLSEVALFSRCYADLTGVRPAKDHALLQSVRTGLTSAVEACTRVLEKASLVSISQATLTNAQKASIVPLNSAASYVPFVLKDVKDPEAVAVLNKFYNFHRMLFDSQDLSNVPPGAYLRDRNNDPTEPAVFMTRVLFGSNIPYSEMTTAQYAVRAIRSLGSWTRMYASEGVSVSNLSFNLAIPEAGLQRGKLWGVGTYAAGNNSWFTDDGTAVSTFKEVTSPTAPVRSTFTARRSYGGGVIGLHSYVMMNSGFPGVGVLDMPDADPLEVISGRSNASRRMHRRWAQNVLGDLLCRPLPALRTEDVSSLATNYVSAFPDAAKQLPFRASSACMACHVTIDPMAATARSLYFFRADKIPWYTQSEVAQAPIPPQIDPSIHFVTSDSQSSRFTGIKPPESPLGGEYSMMTRDPQFYQRPASGDLRFRSYDGSLVWKHITATNEFDGLSQLGTALANTNDLYVCAAARYLQYFTGIEVNLQDNGDSRNPKLSGDDLCYRGVAVQLGLQLKSHQSLSKLVRDIISSNLYRKQGMRDIVP